MRFLMCAAALMAGLFAADVGTAKAQPFSAECLKPIASDEPDVDVREVTLQTFKDQPAVLVTSCSVSRLDRLAYMTVSASVFDKYGRFLNVGGQSLGALSPTNGIPPGSPTIVFSSGTEFAISTQDGARLTRTLRSDTNMF